VEPEKRMANYLWEGVPLSIVRGPPKKQTWERKKATEDTQRETNTRRMYQKKGDIGATTRKNDSFRVWDQITADRRFKKKAAVICEQRWITHPFSGDKQRIAIRHYHMEQKL